VVKFLRRSSQDSSDHLDQNLKIYEDETLTQNADPSAVAEAVFRKLDILQTKGEKSRMLRSIARIRASWVTEIYFRLLSDPSQEIRDFAVQELARRDDWALEKAYEQLRRPPWYAKSAILRILGSKKPDGAVRHIKHVINDGNVDVKRTAALALGDIGGEEARVLLVRLAKDGNRYVRLAAEKALEKLCDFKFS
jgi:hypothetical protein